MNKKEYKNMVEEMLPKENKLINMFIAFITGGTIGIISQIIFNNLLKHFNEEMALSGTLLVLISITALITTIGKGDTLFQKLKCGLIIPITGFAHSISSSIIDYKKEGFISIGSNTFKLAGSVLLYGIVSSIILTLIKVVLNV